MSLPHLAAARPTAAQTFTSRVVLATVGADTWDDDTDRLAEGEPAEVWTGPGSLGQPRSAGSTDAGGARGTDEDIATRTLRLPATAPVAVGHRAYVTDTCAPAPALDEANCYVVTRVETRSNSVIQRCRVVSLYDHRGVPG